MPAFCRCCYILQHLVMSAFCRCCYCLQHLVMPVFCRCCYCLQHLASTQGMASLWQGNLATVLHRIPYSATNFAVYELTNSYLQPRVSNDVARRLTSGALSGLLACSAVGGWVGGWAGG